MTHRPVFYIMSQHTGTHTLKLKFLKTIITRAVCDHSDIFYFLLSHDVIFN